MRAAALAVALTAGFSAPPATATVVGISDNSGAFMHDPDWQALGLRTSRLVMPWDGLVSEPRQIDDWLLEARRAGVEPVVTFEHSIGDHCPSSPCHLPTRAEFDAAFAAFHDRYPAVLTFGAWNEPSHDTQPTANAPGHAAWYAQVIGARCAECTVISEVLLGDPGLDTWLSRYLAALGGPPQVWGIHDYGDVNAGTTGDTDAFLARYQGRVWITETGGIVRFSKAGREIYTPDEDRAAAAIDRTFDLVAGRPRIERVYFYHWFPAAPEETWDSGLFGPDGPRPAFARLVARLAVAPSEPPPGAPAPDLSAPVPVAVPLPSAERRESGTPAPGGAAAAVGASVVVSLPRRWTRARGRSLRVSVRCGGQVACLVTVRVLAAGGDRRTLRVPAGESRVVRLAVPAGVWRRVARRGRATLRVAVTHDGRRATHAVRLAQR